MRYQYGTFLFCVNYQFIVDADISGGKGPIKLGGVTPLYRSRRDRMNGPKLYLETRFSPKAYVKVRKTIRRIKLDKTYIIFFEKMQEIFLYWC